MIIHRFPEIDRAIWKKAGDLDAPIVRKNGQGRHHNNHKVPDETVLAIRRMHEIDRKPLHIVMRAYPELSETYLRSLLSYQLRANLRVQR